MHRGFAGEAPRHEAGDIRVAAEALDPARRRDRHAEDHVVERLARGGANLDRERIAAREDVALRAVRGEQAHAGDLGLARAPASVRSRGGLGAPLLTALPRLVRARILD